jgi:hypothetical protein
LVEVTTTPTIPTIPTLSRIPVAWRSFSERKRRACCESKINLKGHRSNLRKWKARFKPLVKSWKVIEGRNEHQKETSIQTCSKPTYGTATVCRSFSLGKGGGVSMSAMVSSRVGSKKYETWNIHRTPDRLKGKVACWNIGINRVPEISKPRQDVIMP